MKSKAYSISKVIDIDPETLFNVISDFGRYENWNTIIPNAKGALEVGAELQLTMKVDGKYKPFDPKVVSIVPNKSFMLSKIIFSKTILELTHEFEFKSIADNRTELIQTWRGTGLLSIILWEKIKNEFSSFEIFNNNLVEYISKQNIKNR